MFDVCLQKLSLVTKFEVFYVLCLDSRNALCLSNLLSFLTVDHPKITRHPKSKSITTGADVTMTVRATGDNLHYQWQKDGIDLSDDDRHCDTGTHTLHIVKMEIFDNKAHYRCHVKNEIGEEFSREAVLTVSKLVISVVNICFRKLSVVTNSLSEVF